MGQIQEQTLARSVTYRGIGLHTGVEITVRVSPAEPGTGIVFCRTDLPNQPLIEAKVVNITSTLRCTTIGLNEQVQVKTIEHLMAAFVGLNIDNARVELDNGEVPVTDGSSAVWVQLFKEAGLIEQERPRKVGMLQEPLWVEEGSARLIALPAENLQVSYLFTSENQLVGNQFVEIVVNPDNFTDQIAAARTLAFAKEVEYLRKQGLALGGNLEIAVVIDSDRYLNPLRYVDEVARHKALDLIGDLGLVGPLKAHIIGMRSGHSLNAQLGAKLNAAVKWC